MSVYRQTQKQFSLKDMLFNEKKVRQLALEIKAVHPTFRHNAFIRDVLAPFPEQELMERIRSIRDLLRLYLPKDYSEAVEIILAALPPPLDGQRRDNDFGDFIYAPYSYFVATYGCTKRHVTLSLAALREITMRFSAEAALRDFLNAFPKETLAAAAVWARDDHYHVRRLASEGTRPNLPWAKKVKIDPKSALPLLDVLHADRTRYVVRSVANHMNDLTKVDPKLALQTLRRWQRDGRQEQDELAYLIRHSLRTLIKAGDRDALSQVGYAEPELTVARLCVTTPAVRVGEALEFSFTLSSHAKVPQRVRLDYVIHFLKKNGTLSPKTFTIGTVAVAAGERRVVSKRHPLRLMSTRTLYAGAHQLELKVNGQSMGKRRFVVV